MLKKGCWKPDEMWSSRFSFSQFGEDLIIEALLCSEEQKEGFYIDVGAYHPLRYSNSYYFYRRGWRGITIEPNPKGFRKIKQRRPLDICLNVAVSSEQGECSFIADDAYSGLLNVDYPHLGRNKTAEILQVQTQPLSQILDKCLPNGRSIDFLSIDCEGHDLEVLRSNNFEIYRPKLIVVEDLNANSDGSIYEFMCDKGYHFQAKVRCSSFYSLK